MVPPAARAQDNPDPPLAAGMARVVLIRPDSKCDSSIYPIVADENGHFVAELAQNSHLSLDLAPGAHLLVTWPSVDARVEKYPDVDPVGAASLHLKEGETRYVEIFIPQHSSSQCWHVSTFGMRRLRSDDTDLRNWLETTRPITVDRAAGEAEIAQDPQSVKAHLASARRAIQQNESLREERVEAQKSQDGPLAPTTDSTDTK